MVFLAKIDGRIAFTLLFLAFLALPAYAHNVEVTQDVAGTWHIEPNHSPIAGEPAKVWVALTRKGGQILPLEQANCQLGVYTAPRQQSDEPILQPTLQAIAVEQYQGIPGADVVFPKTGLYELELGCTPKTEGDFQPFQMTYDLTVARGAASTPAPQESLTSQETPIDSTDQTESEQKQSGWIITAIILAFILGLGIIRAVLRRAAKR